MALKSANINVMEAAARKAGRGLIRDFGEVEQLQVSRKGPADFVTEADRRADRILRAELSKARPAFGMLTEESEPTEGSDTTRRWIVDPLDGTTNFLHGIPHFAISIGLEENGDIVAGVIFQPVTDELYWAEKGVGAYLNRRRIRVSSRSHIEDAVVATGFPFGDRPGKDTFLAIMGPMMELTAGVRRFGSASLDLAYVASGRYEGFWEYGLGPWDVAAGIVMVREAGGLVCEVGGGSGMLYGDSIFAANDRLHTPLRKLIHESARAAAAAGTAGA
jgi:myo-inositol-1(or 4)-monophosphatase